MYSIRAHFDFSELRARYHVCIMLRKSLKEFFFFQIPARNKQRILQLYYFFFFFFFVGKGLLLLTLSRLIILAIVEHGERPRPHRLDEHHLCPRPPLPCRDSHPVRRPSFLISLNSLHSLLFFFVFSCFFVLFFFIASSLYSELSNGIVSISRVLVFVFFFCCCHSSFSL